MFLPDLSSRLQHHTFVLGWWRGEEWWKWGSSIGEFLSSWYFVLKQQFYVPYSQFRLDLPVKCWVLSYCLWLIAHLVKPITIYWVKRMYFLLNSFRLCQNTCLLHVTCCRCAADFTQLQLLGSISCSLSTHVSYVPNYIDYVCQV